MCPRLMLAFAPTSVGLVSIPKYPFREQKEDFTFVSLLTRPEVITALSKVRAECNKVTSMSLFHSSLSKYSRLEEFEQIQSQTFSQVPGHQSIEDGGLRTLQPTVLASRPYWSGRRAEFILLGKENQCGLPFQSF